jgi:hypothetical protein
MAGSVCEARAGRRANTSTGKQMISGVAVGAAGEESDQFDFLY